MSGIDTIAGIVGAGALGVAAASFVERHKPEPPSDPKGLPWPPNHSLATDGNTNAWAASMFLGAAAGGIGLGAAGALRTEMFDGGTAMAARAWNGGIGLAIGAIVGGLIGAAAYNMMSAND